MDDELKQKLIDKGHKDPSEEPFDEDENKPPEVPDDDDDLWKIPYTLKLNTPVRLGEKTELVTELVFCNAIETSMITHIPVGAFSAFSETKVGHHIPIIARMTGKPSAFISKLKPVDIHNAIGVVSHFFYKP